MKWWPSLLALVSILSHSYPFLFVVRKFKIYPYNTEVHKKVLLALTAVLYIRSPNLFILYPQAYAL